MIVTGRELEYQQQVPSWLRAMVPARFGVEVVRNGEVGQILIISDQLSNRHIDSVFDGHLVDVAAVVKAATAHFA